MPQQVSKDDLVTKKMFNMKFTDVNKYQNVKIQSMDDRKYIFGKYIEVYPMMKLNSIFMDEHSYLLNPIPLKPNYRKKCNECWACCIKIPT